MSPGPSRRILIIGLASPVGIRLSQRLALDPGVERIVGIDAEPPSRPLELGRTEFVRAPRQPVLLGPIIRAARIDTVVDARSPWAAVGTAQSLIAAVDGASSTVQKLVIKSSAHYYGYGGDRPAFLTEEIEPGQPEDEGIRRRVIEAESAAHAFAARHLGSTVTILRFAEEVGREAAGPHVSLLRLPAIPAILGFDPRWQLVEEHDVVGALVHAVDRDLSGTYNVAADGVLALSEIAELLEKPVVPLLPPFGIRRPLRALRRAGLPAPVELMDALRFGRALDNRRFKATGFPYRYTSREAVLRLHDLERPGLVPVLQRSLQDH